MNESKTGLWVLLSVVLTAIIVGGGMYAWQEMEEEPEREYTYTQEKTDTVSEDEDMDNEESMDEETGADTTEAPELEYEATYYQDDATGVSFYFPSDWYNLQTADETGVGLEENSTAQGTFARSFSARLADKSTGDSAESASTIVAVYNTNFDNLGRGGYWADAAMNISSETALESFCDDKEDCTYFTNDNGVRIAKHMDNACTPGGCSEEKRAYYFAFSPSEDWGGVALSASSLIDTNEYDNLGWTAEELEEIMADVVNTLNLK